MKSACDVLEAGVQILAPALSQHGFKFEFGESGQSSGGDFAVGSFSKGDRRLELHFRRALGLVAYHCAGRSLSHTEYIRAMPLARGANAYPGYSSDPLDGFRHLHQDLERFGAAFLSGPTSEFVALADWVASNPRPTGIAVI